MTSKIITIVAVLIVGITAYALEMPDQDKSSILEADSVEYNAEKDEIVATGNVEIFRSGYILKADKIIYDKKGNKIFAIGNVFTVDPDGDEVYADHMEIDRALKEATLDLIKLRMANDSLFAAKKADIFYPDLAELERATYSPCPICVGQKNPQWQFAAKKVYIDKKEERVIYNHGFFEIYGKPVFYTPYFSHPTPNAKPKSGFLVPKLRSTTTYGQGVYVPYYLRIADDKDLIIAPIFTAKQGVVYTAKYQQLTNSGFYTVRGNYNKPKTHDKFDPNHHYFVNFLGQTKLNDNWSVSSDLQRTSDKSYLRNYFSDNKNYLTSNEELLYTQKRDYATVNALYFQELRPTINQNEVPIILPVVDFHKEYEGNASDKYILDSSALVLGRKKGSSTKRMSVIADWAKTYFTDNGQQILLSRRVRGDAYNFAHKHEAPIQRNQNNQSADNIARFIPELEAKWQYPFVKTMRSSAFYIEPIATSIISPNMDSVSKVINEDSQEVEISDENIFSANRYAGYDRVENGLRGAYGLNGYYKASTYSTYGFLIGQAYRFRKDLNYTQDSGLCHNLSDIVGRIGARPWKLLGFSYRLRYDQRQAVIRRNEVRTDIYQDPFHFSVGLVDYNYIQKLNQDQVKKSIDFGADVRLSPQWVLSGNLKQNYTAKKKFLVSSGGSLGYNGDCLNVLFSLNKDFTHAKERNFKKETSFALEIHLKNIN